MMTSASVKAENLANNEEVNYSFTMNTKSLTSFLHLTTEQAEIMEYEGERLSTSIANLKYVDEAKKTVRLKAALKRNLSVAHKIMSTEQYHIYLGVMNRTINNKGLNTILYKEVLAMK